MNTADVVTLVRNNHKFLALSPQSMAQLAQLRQFLALLPTQGVTEDPVTKRVTCDDDALVAAIVATVRRSVTQHMRWDQVRCGDGARLGCVTVAGNNLGRAPPANQGHDGSHGVTVASTAPRQPPPPFEPAIPDDDRTPTKLRASHEARRAAAAGGGALVALPAGVDPLNVREDTTPGEMRLFDLPMRLACVTATAPKTVALLEGPLGGHAPHRVAIQVIALPKPANPYASDAPPCLFGICEPSVLADNHPDKWIALQWRVGLTLPCAAQAMYTTVQGQPTVRPADGNLFVREGDVLTLETRPRTQGTTSGGLGFGGDFSPARGGGSGGGVAATTTAGELQPVTDLSISINGKEVLRVSNVASMRPVGRSVRYDGGGDAAVDPKARQAAEAAALGLMGCRFGVQLCEGATVAVYDLDCAAV